MAKNQGVGNRTRGKKFSENSSESRTNPNTTSRGAARIVAVNEDEVETVAPSSTTEPENDDVIGAEDGGGDELLSEEKVSDTEEEEENEDAEENKINGYANRRGKGEKLEKKCESNRVVKIAKSKAGTSQPTKTEKIIKGMKENGDGAAKQAKEGNKSKEKVKEKKSEGKKQQVLKNVKSSGNTKNGVKDNKQKGNQKSRVEEIKGNTENTTKKEQNNGTPSRGSSKKVDDQNTQKRKQRQEEDEDVRGNVGKKVKGSGDKNQSSKVKKEDSKIKSNGQISRMSKDKMDDTKSKQMKKPETDKQDRRNEKKVENGVKRGAGKRQMTGEAEDEDDEKCESVLYTFPMSRISRMIKSENSNIKMFQVATFVINKATEKFLELFCKEAYACAFMDRKPHVGYNHLSSVVSKRRRFDFLSDYVPKKIKAEEALADAEKAG